MRPSASMSSKMPLGIGDDHEHECGFFKAQHGAELRAADAGTSGFADPIVDQANAVRGDHFTLELFRHAARIGEEPRPSGNEDAAQ
jgi:hypothetical protein